MQMSRQESRSSVGPDHVTLQALIPWLMKSRSRAPAPARPPTSAFQEMATSQRGPKNQCVSVEKQLEEGVTGQHPHHLPGLVHRAAGPSWAWQVGGAPS